MLGAEQIQKYASYLRQYTEAIRHDSLVHDLKQLNEESQSDGIVELFNSTSVREMNAVFERTDFKECELDKIKNSIVNNMTYSSFRTVFLDQLDEDVDLEVIQSYLPKIKSTYMKNGVVQLEEAISETGYYNKVLEMNVSEYQKIYIPAIFIENHTLKIFVSYKFSYGEGAESKEQLISGCVHVDTENNQVTTFIQNSFGKAKADKVKLNSAVKLYVKIKEILAEMNIFFKKRNSAEEQELLFEYCKEMNRRMIEDYEVEASDLVVSLEKSIFNIVTDLQTEINLTKDNKEKIEKKIQSICVSEYMTNKVDRNDLKKKAIAKGLYGYPTRITYKSNDSASSKTSSKGKDVPLPIHEIFHSMNTVFEDTSVLKEIRIAWFERYTFQSEEVYAKKTSVNQTTIESRSDDLTITFNSYSKVNREMMEFVITEIRGKVF